VFQYTHPIVGACNRFHINLIILLSFITRKVHIYIYIYMSL